MVIDRSWRRPLIVVLIRLQFLFVCTSETKAHAREGERASHGGVIRDRRRA